MLLALLPDRRRTFDRTRSDDHIVEFILHADHLTRRSEGIEPEPLTDELIDPPLYARRDMGLGLCLVDGRSAGTGGSSRSYCKRSNVA